MLRVPKNFSEYKRFPETRTPIMSVKRDLSDNVRGKTIANKSQLSYEKSTPRDRIKSIDSANIDPFTSYLNELPSPRDSSPKIAGNQPNRTPVYRTPISSKQQKGSIQSSSSKTVRKDNLSSDQKKRYSLDLIQTERVIFHRRIQELSESSIKIDKSESAKSKERSFDNVIDNENSTNSNQKTTVKKECSRQLSVKQEPSKFSQKRNGIISSYAANTNQGLVRKYNEDRVSIILNIVRPSHKTTENWPRCAFFGIYDGHGGALCADFLRDNLHQYVIGDDNFPENPRQALINGFARAEQEFTQKAEQLTPFDKSGSCAIVVLLVGEICYIANVGDSRAVLSMNKGERALDLSRDHKPCDNQEKDRIIEAGGRVYQSQQTSKPDSDGVTKTIYGPFRTLPGRLSVSRTFGDIEAKLQKYGGKPGVIVPDPEIKAFRVQKSHDYIFMGCDGIFDKMESNDVIKTSWDAIKVEQKICEDDKQKLNTHNLCAKGVEGVIQEALKRRSTDNLTGLVISFIDFQNQVSPTPEKQYSVTPKTTKKTNNNESLIQRKENITPQPSTKFLSQSKDNREIQQMRKQSPAKQISKSEKVIVNEGQKRDKHENITPQSVSNSLQEQRRLSLQFQFNNQAETNLLKQQIKAFNAKTIYDASPSNILQSFHSPILAKKDISTVQDDNSKHSQNENSKIESNTLLNDQQRNQINHKMNCIEKKVNELNSDKYLKALFKESTYSNRRIESANHQSYTSQTQYSSSSYSNNASAPTYQQMTQPKTQTEIFKQFSGIHQKPKIGNIDIPSRLNRVY